MKAVTLGLRYVTNAVGNIIDIVVMASLEGVLPKQVPNNICIQLKLFNFIFQAYEFFLFSGLTLLFMAIFIFMSLGYRYYRFLHMFEKNNYFLRYVDYTNTEVKDNVEEKSAEGKDNDGVLED